MGEKGRGFNEIIFVFLRANLKINLILKRFIDRTIPRVARKAPAQIHHIDQAKGDTHLDFVFTNIHILELLYLFFFIRGIDLENDCNEVNATTERPLHDNSNLTKNFTQNLANDSSQTAAKKTNNSVATVCNSCFKVKQSSSQSESKAGNVKKTKADEADDTKSKQSSNSMGNVC
jgi:hypothetical protein